MPTAEFRFYEELNDFLPREKRKRALRHRFTGTPSVKDTIEAIGVPHTEIDLILVDGRSVGFGHLLAGGERVAVYPMFESMDIRPITRLRPKPLRVPRFVVDVHLGTLARYLRLVGFDSIWRNDYDDPEIIDLALAERRIILTRDRGILRNGRVTHGYWLRATSPLAQLEEVVRALDLGASLRPFSRCMACNGRLHALPAEGAAAAGGVPPRVLSTHTRFRRCVDCGRVYWPGSHQSKLEAVVERARAAADTPRAHCRRDGA
jgi:uncharacterized protein